MNLYEYSLWILNPVCIRMINLNYVQENNPQTGPFERYGSAFR